MTRQKHSVTFSKVLPNGLYRNENYRHLDISVSNISGLEYSRLIRFKIFNSDGQVGLEFRKLPDWPRIFDPWPGKIRDEHGDVFHLNGGDLVALSALPAVSRRRLADLYSSIVEIVEKATKGWDETRIFIADAQKLEEWMAEFAREEASKERLSADQPNIGRNPVATILQIENSASPEAFASQLSTISGVFRQRASTLGPALNPKVRLTSPATKVIVNALGYVGQAGGAGGAGVFLQYLIETLSERMAVDVIVAPGSKNFARRNGRARFIEMPFLNKEALSQLASGPTVVVDPFGALPCAPFPEDMALCCVIHDLMHLERPHFFTEAEGRERSQSFALGVHRADAVITFSADQARAVRRFYPGVMPTVIPHLPYAALRERESANQESIVESPFVLFPAVKWPHKNHRTVIQAFDTFVKCTGSNLRLVLCGGPCAESRFSFFPNLNDLSDRIIDLGHIPNSTLRGLFDQAEAILFPTLYEGFGIPVLEAAYFGKMVIATRLAVFDEILGKEGYYAVEDSLCQLRWIQAFKIIEGNNRASYEAHSLTLRERIDVNAFADKFVSVLGVAAARYIDPSQYPSRVFKQCDRLTSYLLKSVGFSDIYNQVISQKGPRIPVIGELGSTQPSFIYISPMEAGGRACLRATYDDNNVDEGQTANLLFHTWARLRGAEGLSEFNWSVNDLAVVDLLPRLADGEWHLIRMSVPERGYIDFRATRDGVSESSGYELELHNSSLVCVSGMPIPTPDIGNEKLRIFVDSLNDSEQLEDVLSSIERVEQVLAAAAASICWTILIKTKRLDFDDLPELPSRVRIAAFDELRINRQDVTGLVSPYEPFQLILLLSSSDLENCLIPGFSEVLLAASEGNGWAGLNRVPPVIEQSSLWTDNERGYVINASSRVGMPLPILTPEVIQECLRDQPLKSRPRFVVIETDRVGGISHHSVVTGLFLDGAGACGFEPCLGLNRNASKELSDGTKCWYGFSSQVYELGFADTFADELAALVKEMRLTTSDVVFIHSLSPQILLGTARYVASNSIQAPRFIMRFFSTAEAMGGHKLSYAKILKSILSMKVLRAKMHFFCESANLIAYYARKVGVRFPLLLNPEHPALRRVRLSEWLDPGLDGGRYPTLAYFGEARAEKGFDLLPGIVEALLLNPDMAEFRFLVQTGSNSQNQTAEMERAKAQLVALKSAHLGRLKLFQSAETPEEFYFLMKHTVGVISPYRPSSYGKRGTGVTLEAIQMGLKVFCWEDTDLYATFAHTSRVVGVAEGQDFAAVVAAHYREHVGQPDSATSAHVVQVSPEHVCRRMLSLCNADFGGASPLAPILWIGNDTFGEGCSAVYSAQKTALQTLGRDCLELFVPWPDRNWSGVSANAYDAIIYGFDSRYESKGLAWVAKPKFGPALSRVLDEVEAKGPTFGRLRDIAKHYSVPETLKAAVGAQGVTQTLMNYVHHFPIVEGWMPVENVVCETHDIVSYQHAVRRNSRVSLGEKIEEFSAMAKLPKLIAISVAEQREIAGACPTSDVYWRLPPYTPESAADPDNDGEAIELSANIVVDNVVQTVLGAHPEEKDPKALNGIFESLKPLDVIDMALVGSDHPSNVASFEWFLREVFTPYLAPYGYNVVIAGRVCRSLELWRAHNVVLLGRCRRIEPLLKAARVCPLPVQFGSGSPIKTIPAMAVNGAVTVTEHIDKAFGLSAYGVPAFSDPRGFAQDVEALLTDDVYWEHRKALSTVYVEGGLSVQGYAEFWRGVLSA